ncbi:MAG: cytochrome c3 family protein [Deltaproteobacteria bacterium]|nr:cytochrome c3 family protein [Deltaproteobacteria bacterium]
MNRLLVLLIVMIGCLLAIPRVEAQVPEMMPLTVDGKERVCLDCHRLPNIATNEGILTSQALCYECHAQATVMRQTADRSVVLQVTPDSFKNNRHAYIACIDCHRDVARSPHKSLAGAKCQSCHPVHGEGAVGDPHLRVSCQACHHRSKFVFQDRSSDKVRLSALDAKKVPIALTDHALADTKDKTLCLKCHFSGNQVGAAAAVLPAKSVLCLVCHNAPLAVGHSMFWAAFLILLLGLFSTLFFWFQGSVAGEEKSLHRKIALSSEGIWKTLFSRKIGPILKTIFWDVFLQRRILQESVKRWSIHSLIFLSILLRFGISVFTWFAYRIGPDSALARALIDKNNGFVAFAYDFLGLLILLGLLLALTQRFVIRPAHSLSEGQDNLAIGILGVLILLGFFLEGVRILITRVPMETAVYAFIGYPLSILFSWLPWDWQTVYVYLWYAHAAVAAAFIACLPFGKMKHIIQTPLSLILNYKRKLVCPKKI